MEFSKLLDNLRKRVPWPVMQKFISHHGYIKGHGWDETIKKLLHDYNNANGQVQSEIMGTFSGFYEEHLLAGEKAIRLYEVGGSIVKQVIDEFNNYSIPESIYKTMYPLLLDDTQLNKAPDGVFIVDIKKCEDQLMLVFATKRRIKEKIELSAAHFGKENVEELSQYTEIIGIKEYTRQFIDVISLNAKSKYIEMRLDIAANITSDDRRSGFHGIRRAFFDLLSATAINLNLDRPKNLFSAIDKLYRSSDGRVCELAFTTEEASIKHEKMRRKHQCLRSETYHRAGSDAVGGNIAAYRIAATWVHSRLNTQPELLLPGNFRMLSQPDCYLKEAVITKCYGYEDYNFVLNKLNALLDENAALIK